MEERPQTKEVAVRFGDLGDELPTVFEALEFAIDATETPRDLRERIPQAMLSLAKANGFDLRLRPTIEERGTLPINNVLLTYGKVTIEMAAPRPAVEKNTE